jgi:probable rRNA maturation factor
VYRVSVESERSLTGVSVKELEKAALLTLSDGNVAEGAELTIALTDEAQIRALNREYRGIDATTDVLSFEMGEQMPDGSVYLGDVIIAVPVAQRQAETQGHDLMAELVLLVVHGVLHLLGYDHDQPEKKASMWNKQRELTAQLGWRASPTE